MNRRPMSRWPARNGSRAVARPVRARRGRAGTCRVLARSRILRAGYWSWCWLDSDGSGAAGASLAPRAALVGKVLQTGQRTDGLERVVVRVRRAFVADAVVAGEHRLHLVGDDHAVLAHCLGCRSARQIGQRREAPPWRLSCRSRSRVPSHVRASVQSMPAWAITCRRRRPVRLVLGEPAVEVGGPAGVVARVPVWLGECTR